MCLNYSYFAFQFNLSTLKKRHLAILGSLCHVLYVLVYVT